MTEITPETNIWFPAPVGYKGREGDYAKTIADTSLVELQDLVQKRAHEDGEWAIENELVGGKDELMRRMVTWVSEPTNIQQCVGHIVQESLEDERTVDWVCRDLATAAQKIAGSNV